MNDYITLTELGNIYGVAARDVGSWLKNLGLRHHDGRPSQKTIQQGFVKQRVTQYGSQWFWHRDKTCELLDGMCYPRSGAGIEEHDGFRLIRGG